MRSIRWSTSQTPTVISTLKRWGVFFQYCTCCKTLNTNTAKSSSNFVVFKMATMITIIICNDWRNKFMLTIGLIIIIIVTSHCQWCLYSNINWWDLQSYVDDIWHKWSNQGGYGSFVARPTATSSPELAWWSVSSMPDLAICKPLNVS